MLTSWNVSRYLSKSSQCSLFIFFDQELGPSPLAIDAVLFSGGSADGSYLVISAARRADKVLQCIVICQR